MPHQSEDEEAIKYEKIDHSISMISVDSMEWSLGSVDDDLYNQKLHRNDINTSDSCSLLLHTNETDEECEILSITIERTDDEDGLEDDMIEYSAELQEESNHRAENKCENDMEAARYAFKLKEKRSSDTYSYRHNRDNEQIEEITNSELKTIRENDSTFSDSSESRDNIDSLSLATGTLDMHGVEHLLEYHSEDAQETINLLLSEAQPTAPMDCTNFVDIDEFNLCLNNILSDDDVDGNIDIDTHDRIANTLR